MFMNDTIIFRDRSQLVESGDLVLFRDSIQSAGGGAWRLKDGIKTAGKNGEVKTWHKNHDSLSKMEVYLAFQAKKNLMNSPKWSWRGYTAWFHLISRILHEWGSWIAEAGAKNWCLMIVIKHLQYLGCGPTLVNGSKIQLDQWNISTYTNGIYILYINNYKYIWINLNHEQFLDQPNNCRVHLAFYPRFLGQLLAIPSLRSEP